MAQLLPIKVLSCHLGRHPGYHFGKFNFFIFRHSILRIQFKCEPNQFVNGSAN